MWVRRGFGAPEFSFLVLRRSKAGRSTRKQVIRRS
jgi:hypothetical protein